MSQLHCPFCGSTSVKIQVNNTYTYVQASGRCNKCHTRGPLVKYTFKQDWEKREAIKKQVSEQALNLWNNRV